jgi:uncharacterized protein YbdZ (MbtH family)
MGRLWRYVACFRFQVVEAIPVGWPAAQQWREIAACLAHIQGIEFR